LFYYYFFCDKNSGFFFFLSLHLGCALQIFDGFSIKLWTTALIGLCLGVQSARDWWICEMGCSKSGVSDGGFLCAKWYEFFISSGTVIKHL
jgi:hypothetical protein